MLIGEGRFGLQALSTSQMRFVSKRLAGLIRYQYTMGTQSLPLHLIEQQLVEELYAVVARELLEAGLVAPGYLSTREVVIFYSE